MILVIALAGFACALDPSASATVTPNTFAVDTAVVVTARTTTRSGSRSGLSRAPMTNERRLTLFASVLARAMDGSEMTTKIVLAGE